LSPTPSRDPLPFYPARLHHMKAGLRTFAFTFETNGGIQLAR
jgi:hypothetical protein